MTALPNVTPRKPRTDMATMALHWGLVLTLLLSLSTGWRIASMTNTTAVLHWIDALLLQGNVLRWHFVSATVLVALVVAYVVFLWRMGLGGRLTVRWSALRSTDRATRWQAINRLMYWLSFALLGGAAVTGTLLYYAPGLLPSELLITWHQGLSWGFVAYIGVHILAQLLLGGVQQLLKMVKPRLAYGMGALAALGAGLAGATVVYVSESGSLPNLVVARTATPPTLDGVASDAVWQSTPEAVVGTNRGFGLDGGDVNVHVRALHDGENAYFLFRWKDATRSQKHIPLQKTAQGWKLLHSNYHNNDENEYYEDKFAVMLARSALAGGDTINLGKQPLSDKPGPSNGLGLHATSDGSLADVWHWKSVRTGTTNQFDDNHFGPPMVAGKPGSRYTGGYTQDPSPKASYAQNFSKVDGSPYIKVKYLPKDLAAQQQRMGHFDPNPNVGDDGQFSMLLTDVQPWTEALDADIPVGTVIPSVLIDKPLTGDRGDVAVHAKWQDGWWTLEAKRKLDTASKFDQPITNGMYVWVAVFDHNQVRHTRHVRPLQLQVQ